MRESKARLLVLTGAGVLSQAGMTLLIVGLSFGKSPPPAPPPAVQAAAIAHTRAIAAAADLSAAPDASTPSYVTPLARSRPVHLSVPRVGIETGLMELGLQSDGTIEVPPDDSTSPAGWYRYLASPGEVGAAVIVGHLDSPQAPAVFFNLGAMRPGDHLSVIRADGTTANFTVTEVGSYPRDQFPTQAVYGASPTPVLRLVTCGGPFKRGEGYDGNVVVFAEMDSSPGLPTDAPGAAPAIDSPATPPTSAPVGETPPVVSRRRLPAVASDTRTERVRSTRSGEENSSGDANSTDVPSTAGTSTETSTSQRARRHTEVVEPEQRQLWTPTRGVPRRVRTTPQPVYVPPEAD